MDAYAFSGDLYCERCVRSVADRVCIDGEAEIGLPCPCMNHVCDSHCCAQGPMKNGGGEADLPQHCGNCLVFLENPLTTEGYLWVRDEIRDHLADLVEVQAPLGLWVEHYGYDEIMRKVGP